MSKSKDHSKSTLVQRALFYVLGVPALVIGAIVGSFLFFFTTGKNFVHLILKVKFQSELQRLTDFAFTRYHLQKALPKQPQAPPPPPPGPHDAMKKRLKKIAKNPGISRRGK